MAKKKRDDYELTHDFLDMLKKRGLRESLLVADTGDDCTIHVEIAGQELHFDFDADNNLVDIRND